MRAVMMFECSGGVDERSGVTYLIKSVSDETVN